MPEPSLLKRRSLGELRADAFSELLLDGDILTADGAASGRYSSMRGIVQVSTPLTHLPDASSLRELPSSPSRGGTLSRGGTPSPNESLSRSGTPSRSVLVHHTPLPLPELQGYGPIPVPMAKRVAAEAPVWLAAITEPATGNVLSVNRYRPSEEQRRLLAVRDERCRFLGCQMPAYRCEIDHTVDAALGGPTTTMNLGHLCKSHHRLKHHSGWKVIQHPDGNYEWTSPTGRRRIDRPASRVRFMAAVSESEEPDVPTTEPCVDVLIGKPAELHVASSGIPEWAWPVDTMRPIDRPLGPEVEFPF